MKLKPQTNGKQVLVRHHQTLRQSHDYQSAEMSYGVELLVDNSTVAIRKGFRQAERLVEDALADKFKEQQKLLQSLAKANRS
jgi:hypothetical protein